MWDDSRWLAARSAFMATWSNCPSGWCLPEVVVKVVRIADVPQSSAEKRYKVRAPPPEETEFSQVQDFKREIAVWHLLSHPNIVPFFGICEVGKFVPAVVSGYMRNGMCSNPRPSDHSAHAEE